MEHTMEHTKGPWKVGGHTSIIIYTEQGWPVADANLKWGEEEARANARLIASAPALLEALKDLLGNLPDLKAVDGHAICRHCGRDYDPDELDAPGLCPSDDCPGYIARAAIAQAEGE